MAEVRFYHLTERPLEWVLPVLLERSLERGWRVTVRGTDPARIEALSAHLWTYRDDSFLPHGTPEDGNAARQPRSRLLSSITGSTDSSGRSVRW